MSLKGFHLIFITVSSLLAMGVGAWCVWVYLTFAASSYLTGAVASFAITLGLVVYGAWFYKKMKRLRIFT